MSESDDAKATAECAIRDALSEWADVTGLSAGTAMDTQVEKILEKILDPSTRWAFESLLEDARVEDPVTEDGKR